MRPATIFTAFAALLALSACATAPRAGSPTPASWGAMLNLTDSLATAGRHAAADSVLLAFEQANAGTRAAEETVFWRALYKMDPRSSAATRAEGRAMMDSYAASPTTSWYRGQANVLRHIAREIELAQASTGDTTIVITDTSPAGIAARDRVIRNQRADIARLNTEISRLNAELERIKRRLATPSP